MLTSDLVQATYAFYTLLILQKYLGNFLIRVRSYDLGLFGGSEKEEAAPKEEEKESTSSYYVGRVKQWVIATTGITAAYLTGSMQYVLPIVNVLITVFSNLPAFTKVGAPMLCITLKLYGFKYAFLRGWFVLTILVIAGAATNMMGVVNDNVAVFFCAGASLEVFILYQVSTDEIYAYLKRMQKWLRDIDYKSIFFNIADEIVTNG